MDFKIKRKIIFFLIFFHIIIFGKGALDDFINQEDLFFRVRKSFKKSFLKKYNFSWTDKNYTSLRSYKTFNTYLAYKASEIIINFEKDKVHNLEIYFYSHGEDGVINKNNFETIIANLSSKILNSLNSKLVKIKKDRKGFLSYNWKVKNKQYLLTTKKKYINSQQWDYKYIKLTIFELGGKIRKKNFQMEIKNNILKKKNGDIYVSVPMVDQGEKGYCVCASVARILQYFGRKGDQYEIANLMDSSNRGTNVQKMVKGLKFLAREKQLKMQKINISRFPIYDYKMIKEVKKFVNVYNKLAIKNQMKPIFLEDVNKFFSFRYFPVNLYREIRKNAKIFIDTRVRLGGANFFSFVKTVEKKIKKGSPIFWIVTLGFVKEQNKQMNFGNHMRLIIGYNSKKKEIIYTDSWGKGHEYKKLNYEGAYAMTRSLYILSL